MSANFHSFPHNTIKKVENISNEEYDKIENANNLNWKPVDKAFGAEVLQKSTFPKTTLTVFGAFFLIAVIFGIAADSLDDAVTSMALFMFIPLIISYICEKVWRNGDNKKFRSEKSDYVLLEIDHIKRRLFWKYAVIYIRTGKHICRVRNNDLKHILMINYKKLTRVYTDVKSVREAEKATFGE